MKHIASDFGAEPAFYEDKISLYVTLTYFVSIGSSALISLFRAFKTSADSDEIALGRMRPIRGLDVLFSNGAVSARDSYKWALPHSAHGDISKQSGDRRAIGRGGKAVYSPRWRVWGQ